MQSLMNTVVEWTGANTWVGRVFIIIFLALTLDLIQRVILKRLEKKLQATDNPWDDALLHSVLRPLTLLIWVLGLSFAAGIAAHETNSAMVDVIAPLRSVGVIFSIAWFLYRLILNFEKNIIDIGLQDAASYDRSTPEAIGKLLRVSVMITSALVMLQTLGFSIAGVLAFGGVGGIAIGFAAKDLLANFFGGLFIYLDRPFSVGDWINSPDKDIEGTVESIGWRLTKIRSFDKRPIYVPNATFTSIAVVNPSRMSHRRIKETFGVRYDDVNKLDAIIKDVRNMLLQHPEIDTEQTLMVNLNGFAPSSLDFFIYTFTKTTVWTKYHDVKQDVLFKIHQIIDSHDAEMAFPTSTVHIPENIVIDNKASN